MDLVENIAIIVRSAHTVLVESNSSKTEVQWSKVYYDFMQDSDNEATHSLYRQLMNDAQALIHRVN